MRMQATLLRTVPELEGQLPRIRTPRGPCLTLKDGTLTVWDQDLRPLRHVPTRLPSGARLLDARADLSALVAAVDGGLRIVADTAHPNAAAIAVAADSATFITPNRLVVTSPGAPAEGRSFSEFHRVLLMDLEGVVLDEHQVEVDAASAHALAHPTDPAVLCDFVMGQDGNVLTVIRAEDDALTLREVLPAEEFVNRGFSPDGTRVLLPPYPMDPRCAVIATWPELVPVARLDVQAELPEVEIGIDLWGGFLDDESVLLLATEQGPIVATADLRDAALVPMVGLAEVNDGEGFMEMVAPLSSDRFAGVVWKNGTRQTTVWRLERV
ncbi:hypothetical protein [Nannocystis punicea]|uniref:WD40 repeat domain-containing protein n=1 Tax=Nannocystis punicea TaxID=2995304 RepID=A0ABY7GUT1_9BACT|nr:hypothetical protein [Nannocystis poenicansa]WAS90650.1 hypothetical protein O0S08_31060 [Nannocystis poenicansa]